MNGEMDYSLARQEMVREQIERRGLRSPRLLAAFRKVPRHLFVPVELRERAYDDGPLPIGKGQTISQPYIVALMTSLLGLEGDERVLEIGTGSGYQAAILGELAKEVHTVERHAGLALRAAMPALLRLGELISLSSIGVCVLDPGELEALPSCPGPGPPPGGAAGGPAR